MSRRITQFAAICSLCAASIAAANVRTLKPIWRVPLALTGLAIADSSDKLILLTNEETVVGISSSTGKVVWTTNMSSKLPRAIPFKAKFLQFGLCIWTPSTAPGLLEFVDPKSGKSLWQHRFEGKKIEGVEFEGTNAILCLQNGGNHQLAWIDFSEPHNPKFFDKLSPEVMGSLKKWAYAFGPVVYAVRNQGSKGAWMDKLNIDTALFPAEGSVQHVWPLPSAYDGILTTGEFDPHASELYYRPVFTFARWSNSLEHRYWSFSGYLGDTQSHSSAFVEKVVTWKDKVWAISGVVSRIEKTPASGLRVVAKLTDLLVVDGRLFGVREPDNNHVTLYRTKDGETFVPTIALPTLPLDSWTEFGVHPVPGGCARIVGQTRSGVTTKTLELYRF